MARNTRRAGINLLAALGIGLWASIPWTTAHAETTAEDKGEDTTTTLEAVVVTAQKRSERLVDVPISVMAVDAAQLQNAGIEGLQDLNQVAVGTRINRVGIYLQPSIRGITTQVVGVGQENNVAVYVDG